MPRTDNEIIKSGLSELRKRLPSGWAVDLDDSMTYSKISPQPDGFFRVKSPDGRETMLLVEAKRRLDPRGVLELAYQLRRIAVELVPLAVTSFVSNTTRDRLREAGISYIDLVGNARIELKEPGLYIETRLTDRDPLPDNRPARSLKGPKAGRVVRTLVDTSQPPGVRELARLSGVDPSYASRVLSLLTREALVDRTHSGGVAAVDWQRLLRRWAEDAPLLSRGMQAFYLEPRGLTALLSELRTSTTGYAITGSLAASRLAPIAPPRLATIYVRDIAAFASALGLRPTEAGANVLLVRPLDDSPFIGTVTDSGLEYVAPSQAVVDLLSSPGRGPAEAEEIMIWMSQNEEIWRG